MADFFSFNELISFRAAEDGNRVFIYEPGEEGGVRPLSFQDLKSATEKIAEALGMIGFLPGCRILTLFQNGIASSAAFLAIVAAGGIAVPVNPAGAPRELEFLIENSGACFILTGGSQREELRQKIPEAEWYRETVYSIHIFKVKKPVAESPQADLALILYTSGTTGVPKGVMLTTANLFAECGNIRDAHELTKNDKVLCLLPLNHINGLVVTLLTPLFAGFSVVMPPKFSAGKFWNWVCREQVTWFSAVPTIYSILLSRETPPPAAYPLLRFARSASAALSEAVLHEFERRTGVPLIESYGITEGGSQITSNPLPPRTRKALSVGIPFGNEIQVVLKDGAPAPVGATGEVRVRGANIAKAYYRNKEAGAESFKDGWFFTGDLGRMDEDGYLFLTGRLKELINRAGEMISPREIDEVLYRIPEIELAAAVGVP
ncbi:MAG: AMP-binding protein, partial [Treponema sp.]|nr:AMP-binding protein [Treponema sp.]